MVAQKPGVAELFRNFYTSKKLKVV